MAYSKEKLDNEFEEILAIKTNRLKCECKGKHERDINVDCVLNIGMFINDFKPKSKYRDYKRQILEYLNVIEQSNTLSKKELEDLRRGYLSDIIIFLQSDHSFVEKNSWFWFGTFALVLDVILMIFGIAKFYYYVPIFTAISITRNVIKEQKAKRENRLIDI